MNGVQQFSQPKSVHIIHKPSTSRVRCSQGRTQFSPITKKNQKSRKRLVKISTADGKWHGNWSVDYNLSLKQLHLQDLAEDGHQHSDVSINLCIHKHTGFGLSVEGRIITSFSRICSNCSSPYCRQINTNFTVWVLPLMSKKKSIDDDELPVIGGDDPSVIYVKPGDEADLDSLVQDSIRLATSVKETCSEACDRSEPKLQYLGVQNSASVEKRWSRLLELKNSYRQ